MDLAFVGLVRLVGLYIITNKEKVKKCIIHILS